MSLRKLLKNFCTDAYQELTRMGELPRPPYDSPLIAGNVIFTHPLSKLMSYTQLQEYMRSSGLSDKLRDIGHTWLWHYEVFEWLFLERVIAESSGISLDVSAFNKVFYRALAEISRSSLRLRHITVLNGLPKLSRPIVLGTGVLILPTDYSSFSGKLADMLGWRFQDRNRGPSFIFAPDSCLLVQDYVISKGNQGRELLQLMKQRRSQADDVIKALKLSLDTPICPKAVYSSHLSSFPLFPIYHEEFEEYSEILFDVQRPITRAEILNIQRNFRFIHHSQSQTTPEHGFFDTALNRFADSYRIRRAEQNIVDLIVALEAMLDVRNEELKRRLATYAAFLLGTNDSERQTFYRQVSAGYDLRNAIVHGGKDQTQKMTKALKRFFPELNNKPQNEVVPYVRKATEKLQKVVRLVLRAYIYMRSRRTRTEWLKVNDFEYLPFDSNKRCLIQKQLGVKRSPANQPDITDWHF